MPPVGRPRTRTAAGTAAPVNQISIPYNGMIGVGGVTGASLVGGLGSASVWSMFQDEWEYVPELRWPHSIPLFDQMRTDSQLAGLLTATMWGISQLRFVLDTNGADPKMVTELSEDLNLPIMGKDDQPRRRMKKRFSHSQHVFQAMLAAIYGHVYFEQLGTIVDGKWRLRKLFPIMPQTIKQILVNREDGGLVGISQWGKQQLGPDPDITPVDRLVGFVFQAEGKDWTGRSMLRDCYKDWLMKDRNMRVEAINHERAGGIPIAEAAMGSTDDDVAALGQMMQKFRIGDTAGGAVPYGTKVNIAKGTGSDINDTIKRYDESMARRFLLQLMNLAQGGQHVGSYALGETFMDSFLVGQRVIAQWYCDTMTEHVIEDWVDWNYGPETDLTPRITWERSTEDSLGADTLALLVQRGVITVDQDLENAIRYKYMLPTKTEPRPEITPAGPNQPAINKQTPQTQQSEQPGSGAGQETVATPTRVAASAGLEDRVLPPSEGPAPVRASIWDRIWRKKPDVMAASAPNLVTVPNVPILEAGVEYKISTGKTTFTPEDLVDAVTAANEDPAIPSPRLKLGHIDPRYNDDKVFDASPSFGMCKNLRLSENGMCVYADFVGVPKWLAEILPTAFPNRSIEGYWGVKSQAGGEWRFVLSACALLGVVWPGINQLEDLPQLASYYGETMPPGVQMVEDVAASVPSTGGDPMPVAASANLDDVRRAFYTQYVPQNTEARWWWIRQVLTDPNELVVEDDESGQLYKLAFSSNDTGEVSFEDALPVRIDYIPDTRDAQKAAASHVAAALAAGRKVAASWSTREDSVLPTTASGGAMDPKEIRQRLGLSEDASDEQVQEALIAGHPALQTAETAGLPGVAPHDPTATGGVRPVSTGVPEPSPDNAQPNPQPVLPPEAASTANGTNMPPGMVMIDAATLDTLKVGASAALEEREERLKRERENLVAAAIGDGQIAPASRDHWIASLEQADKVGDPGMRQALASLPKGLIPVGDRPISNGGVVPVAASQIDDEFVQKMTDEWFPEVARSRARGAAVVAAGASLSTRVAADANYRR